jgi:hypothetical protein
VVHGRRLREIVDKGAFDIVLFNNVSLVGGPELLRLATDRCGSTSRTSTGSCVRRTCSGGSTGKHATSGSACNASPVAGGAAVLAIQQVWVTIGSAAHIGVDDARNKARGVIALIRAGKDRAGPKSFAVRLP